MKNFLKEFKQLSLWSMVLFISFVINSCDENNNSTKESVNKTGTYLIKADLTELINKIGDRDLKLIELIKNNPVSMIKAASYQKTKTSSSEYYFDTDNIMVIKDYNNQAVYIIPAYKSSNARDNNIYSISINITDDFIDTKLNVLQLKEDGTQESISYDFVYSSSTSKTSKVKDIECYCTVTVSDCTCHTTHAAGGCDYPIISYTECSCSGGASFGTATGSNAGATVISNIWASSGGGTNYGYTYNYTGDIVYAKLTNIIKQSFTDFTFSSLQQLNIKESFEISNIMYGFLKTEGVTLNNKNFVVSIFDAIEEGTVTNYEQSLVLLNAYKQAQEFLAFKNQFFIDHPTTTEAQFENWFGGTTEGFDGNYDAAFWDNPNLTFQQQNLPTYNNYVNGMARFPNGNLMTGADNIYGLVGGNVLNARVVDKKNTENTCALKVSIALNNSGVVIPYIPGQTIEGGGVFQGKYFFLNAKSLNSWMRKTFGTNPATTTTPLNSNHKSFTSSDGGVKGVDFPFKLKDFKGIYSMITTEAYDVNGASGHADLLITASNGLGTCAYGCFFNLPIERIDVWILY